MRVSRRFINFALFSCFGLAALAFAGCKGRTADNMEPNGQTIEVVIAPDNNEEM